MAKAFSLKDFERPMLRAIELAKNGPAEDPNPRVGCVVVDENLQTVAEGWHNGSGTPHAEVDALSKLSPSNLKNAKTLTAIVTLEPCNHTGVTGPCSEALVSAGIGRVVYGSSDTGNRSQGGAERLREAGVEVFGGLEERLTDALINDWRRRSAEPDTKPRVTVKWAQTLDGFAAAADATSKWITGAEARQHVHAQRAKHEAIMVGTGTLYADNPWLTARAPSGDLLTAPEGQPFPVIIGKREIPKNAHVLEHPALGGKRGKEVLHYTGENLEQDLLNIKEAGFSSVYVEGGPTLVASLLKEGLVDELHVYIAPSLLGAGRGAVADLGIDTLHDALHLRRREILTLGKDTLIIFEKATQETLVSNLQDEEK